MANKVEANGAVFIGCPFASGRYQTAFCCLLLVPNYCV